MKILYINSKQSDYLQDLTYTGFVKILGIKNIVDYKWNKHFHINYKEYPKNLSYVKNSLISSIKFNLNFKDFDYVFVGSCKADCFETYLSIINKIPAKTPVILIDGGDNEEIGGDMKRLNVNHLYEKAIKIRSFDFIFKREYIKYKQYAKNIFPLPFSCNLDVIPTLKNSLKYDVSFWAVESHSDRTKALEILQNKFDCASNGTVLKQEFKKYKRKGIYYLQELSQCKIALNIRGSGWDTLRYWEVPALNRFMISQELEIEIPNNFRNHKEIVFCKPDLSDLLDLCEYYLKNDLKREEIAKNSKKWAQTYHTDEVRAKYILEKLLK